ncbi:hypothetical protein SGRA_1782 [Saprospira grandis str. Lewin]|uniref:Uncharacterized protein n=1 Tax=Saprospira grandis (strain Lewin) TaxID=984262 RepID=H6KZC7_SAPGL|nr:hypothetical protein SGRA_1782 [Saprospira grandis str. Lewin]
MAQRAFWLAHWARARPSAAERVAEGQTEQNER